MIINSTTSFFKLNMLLTLRQRSQNFETKVLACQRAITARIRISTIHMISALGIKEFSQYAL